MYTFGPGLGLEFVLYLFSPLLVPLAFAAVGLAGEAVAKALTRV